MATYVVGKPKAIALGELGGVQAKKYAKQYSKPLRQGKVAKPKTYFVLSRAFTNKFTGGNCGSNNGTLYGVFTTFAAAEDYIKANKLRLHAQIVAV